MQSIHKISTVARYEIKTLLRSWFFRIFAGLAIVILVFMNVPFFALKGNTPWLFRGISASIPYMNILLLNVAQAIIAVFLASDFLKRDKKLDTTEVVYMRSMNNSDYVLGKFSGILLVFLGLNALVLLVAVIFNVFFSDVAFVVPAYLLYPLLISIPTLVFIFGLSFFLMVTIRNQAVTFIVLLGYIAITLFFLSQKLNYLFDYMTFNVPLMYSDFVGFANLSTILIHRGIYLFLGLGFIFATILLIKRLPQSKAMSRISVILTILFLGTAFVLGGIYLNKISAGKSLRQAMVDLNKKYQSAPRVKPLKWDLNLKHNGEHIDVTAKLRFQNITSEAINSYLFSLNPGLEIKEISSNGKKLGFDREKHIITISPEKSLLPETVDSLTIHYQGKINEQACYVDIDEEDRAEVYRLWIYNVAKRFAFIEPNFVLLTPEVVWYPVAGVPYGAAYPELAQKDFLDFSLNVTTDKKLTAISQGRKTEIQPGNYSFNPEHPMSQLSLVIGNYESRSVQVDSIEYNLIHLKGHNYYSSYFTEIGDTLKAIIRDAKQSFEGKIGLEYPFQRFSLVEVPIQFFSYPRIWTTSQESVQPEMVLLSEQGILLDRADFSRMKRWQDRRRERSNQTLTPQEIESDLFSGFINTFTGSFSGGRMMGDLVKTPVYYSIFPNYYTFTNNFQSERLPVFNFSLESFLSDKVGEGTPPFRRFFVGLTEEEKANLALAKQNLAEILNDPEQKEIVSQVLKMKGSYLFKLIESKIGTENFQKFLVSLIKNNRFKSAEVRQMISTLNEQYNFDIEPYFESWYQERQLPGFLISNVEAYKILDKDRTRFQIKFKVSNTEPVDGLLSVTFRTGRGGGMFFGRGPQETPIEKMIPVAAGQTKEVGFVLDESPRMLSLNTLISKNLPSVITRDFFDELELNEKAQPFDGERIIEDPIALSMPNEIVVDNEDPGFELLHKAQQNFLKRLLKIKEDQEKYAGINFWRPPSNWRGTTLADFYGKYIHSAYYIKSGEGNKKVAWKTELKESGTYDVYYYTSKINAPWFRRRGEGRGGRRDEFVGQFHFKIYHDDGADDAVLDVANAEAGWNFLGSYYLSADTAKVELSDLSKGRLVFADAVKWVKR